MCGGVGCLGIGLGGGGGVGVGGGGGINMSIFQATVHLPVGSGRRRSL